MYRERERRWLPTGDRERRTTAAAPELRRAPDDTATRVVGYAAIFDEWVEIWPGFREVIRPGAFAGAVDGDVRALREHDPMQILGRTKAGTLRLSEDAKGLRCEIDLPDTDYAEALRASMARGDVDQMSFGFRAKKNGDRLTITDDVMERELLDVELLDVSVVTFPAYAMTEASLRSIEAAQAEAARAAAPVADYSLYRARLRLAAA